MNNLKVKFFTILLDNTVSSSVKPRIENDSKVSIPICSKEALMGKNDNIYLTSPFSFMAQSKER